MSKIKQFSALLISISLFGTSALALATTETAIFAGGCFWTMQKDFDKVPGVMKTTAGYTGGTLANPTYEQVENGDTGHYESVKVVFDPQKISYKDLVNYYWHNIDPTNAYGQFCDSGNQYRPVIFYGNQNQMAIAMQSKLQVKNSGRFTVVATQILPASTFYPAEEYHQEFAKKNPVSYNMYRIGCGRDGRLDTLWKNAQ